MTLRIRTFGGRTILLDFRLLLAAVAVSRLVVVPWRVILLVREGGPTDLPYFLQLARLSDQGLYPYVHFWVEYPPIFPGLVVAAYRFSRWVAVGAIADAWFYALIMLTVIACELGVFLLLYRIALLLGNRETALRSALLYALLFVPGYLWAGWFDHLPTLFFLAALYLLLTERHIASGVLVGLGFVSKVFPVLLVPLALCTVHSWRRRLGHVVAFTGTVALFVLPLLAINPPTMIASIRTALSRPSWETIWALIDGYYGYGVVAPLAAHLDPASSTWASHGSSLPWMPITLLFGLLFVGFYVRFYGVCNRRQLVAAAAFTLHLLLLYSRGYSPQYLTWLAPLLVILLPNRQGALYLALLGLLNVIELPVYFSFFPDQRALLVFTVGVRTALLISLAIDYFVMALSPNPMPARAATVSSLSQSVWTEGRYPPHASRVPIEPPDKP